ncbi:hypothetical protein GJAV_G00232920 [Gymnothorax javanicus]|nr:hypothetical protein GJAV_G00232920 [Gymnothorax javanicus]
MRRRCRCHPDSLWGISMSEKGNNNAVCKQHLHCEMEGCVKGISICTRTAPQYRSSPVIRRSTDHFYSSLSETAMPWICFLLSQLSLAISTLAINPSQIKVFPENGAISGVILASLRPVQNKPPPYAFNASQAREVCLLLNMIIASKAQVVEAHRHGFETCRYGWVDEQIAVLPRITASKPCGQSRVGVIEWRSIPTRSFDAYCFYPSDITTDVPVGTVEISSVTPTTTPKNTSKATPTTTPKATPTTTPKATPTTTPKATPTTTPKITPTTTPKATPMNTPKATPITTPTTTPTTTPKATPTTSLSPLPTVPHSLTMSTSLLPQTTTIQSAPSTQSATTSFSSTLSPPLPSSNSLTPASLTSISPSTSYLLPLTTLPAHPTSITTSPVLTKTLSPKTQDTSSSESPVGITVAPHDSSVTAVVRPVLFGSTAILLLLVAVIGLWYYKTNRSGTAPFCRGGQQNDDMETEVWENLYHKDQHTELEMGGFTYDAPKQISLEEES